MDSTPVSLIRRVQEPCDDPSWERFVRLFTPLIVEWAKRFGLQDSDADDLTQDVFCILVRRLPTLEYDPTQSFRAWLWTVTYHAWQRKQRRQPLELLSNAQLDALQPADEPPPYSVVEYRQYLVGRATQIMQADFNAPTWQAFWEVVVNRRPGAEVAKQLGLSVNAVYLARCRVLRRLREELAGLMD
jgi:RNA polymerase sigma-70 factor (ECF subfamily)